MTHSRVSDSRNISHYKKQQFRLLVVYYSTSGLENSDVYKHIFANIIGNSLKQPTKCPSVVKQIRKSCECVSVSRAATIFFHFNSF